MEVIAEKICSRCKAEKQLTDFCKDSNRKDGRYVYCKECVRSANKKFYVENKERLTAEKRAYEARNHEHVRALDRASYYRTKYGLTIDEVTMLRSNGCNICGSTSQVRIDHCHKTQKVRGALCHNCNVALGHAKESPERLRQLAAYLEVGE